MKVIAHDPEGFADSELAHFMDNARIALTISSCQAGDHPLIYANQRFCDLSGYSLDQIIGRNCRFLQRDMRQQEARFHMRNFVIGGERENLRCSLVNFRADGTPFVNLVFLSRIRTIDKQQCFIFASQFDVTNHEQSGMYEYEMQLMSAAKRVRTLAGEHRLLMDQTIDMIANSAAIIAESKLTLRQLDAQ